MSFQEETERNPFQHPESDGVAPAEASTADGAAGRRCRPKRRRPGSKRPSETARAIGAALAWLGASRISENLNEMASAARSGSLPLSGEAEASLFEASAALLVLRRSLMNALNSRRRDET